MSFQIDFPAQPRFPILAPDGTAAAPSYSFGGASGTGMYLGSGQIISFARNGSLRVSIGSDSLNIVSDAGELIFGLSGDAKLVRDAANTLALRNGTSAQTFRVYNTYTDASNYERGVFDWSTLTNTLSIGTQRAGAGTTRAISFLIGGVSTWSINASGHLVATDNTYDIGASGATRPRTIYAGTGISAPLASFSTVALGGAGQAARVNLPAATTTVTHMNFTAGVAPTSPNNGDFWFDGTDFKARVGGVTKTFTIL